MNNTGGGSATNSGVDFQQRVAAFFALSMGLNLDCSTALGYEKSIKIKKISFETNDSIDDIKLVHKSSITYIQAKRQLSLSESQNSDFFKTIEQFYNQHKYSQNPKDSYALITTGDTSKKIITELKKITKSLQLNTDALIDNPLSQAESETLQKIQKIVRAVALKNQDPKISDDEINKLLTKTHIITMDLEEGGSYESGFLISIACQLSIQPRLVWSYIISKCLDWSKNRQSVTFLETKELLDKFIKTGQLSEPKRENHFHFAFDPEHFKISSGREVILIKSPVKKNEIVLIELERFDSNGQFKLKFIEGSVVLSNGDKYELYGRAATIKGAARLFQTIPESSSKTLLLPDTASISKIDNTPIALAYSEKIRSLITNNSEVSKCIHCGEGLSHNIIFIEVQEEGIPFDTGAIHKNCRRFTDRVLGTGSNPGIDLFPELKNFDYKKWFTLLPESQAIWGSLEAINTKVRHILWTPDQETTTGAYCIKVTLEDNSTRYIQHRGKIQRFTSENAEIQCAEFIEQAKISKLDKNPMCYSFDGDVFSDKNAIMHTQQGIEEPVECQKFEKTTYTRGLSTVHDKCKNFYAPLVLIADEYNNPVLFNGMAFLITNPIQLQYFLNNWRPIFKHSENYKLRIIEDDKQFDFMIFKIREKASKILVDPIFDSNIVLLSGSTIRHMDDLQNNFTDQDF